MNEEQKALLTDALKEVLGWVETTKDFATAQAPLIVNEILRWGIVAQLYDIAIGVGLLIATWKIYAYTQVLVTKKNSRDKDETISRWNWWMNEGCEATPTITVFGMICTGVFSAIFLLIGVYHLLYVLMAPRMYLLGKLSSLL